MQIDLLPSRPRVLLVDDDDLIRVCLTELLSDAGWRVTPAASAAQALQIADATGIPDIIVTDLRLGRGMNGLALITAARKRWPLVRAVLISGSDGADPVLAPCDEYLRKPFSSDALLDLVTALDTCASGPDRGTVRTLAAQQGGHEGY